MWWQKLTLPSARWAKKYKSSTDDMVRKEFIKLTSNMFLSLNIDLFNLIFDSGIIPNTKGQKLYGKNTCYILFV